MGMISRLNNLLYYLYDLFTYRDFLPKPNFNCKLLLTKKTYFLYSIKQVLGITAGDGIVPGCHAMT